MEEKDKKNTTMIVVLVVVIVVALGLVIANMNSGGSKRISETDLGMPSDAAAEFERRGTSATGGEDGN